MKRDHFARSQQVRCKLVEEDLTPDLGIAASPNAWMSYFSGLKGIEGKYKEF